MKRLRIFVLLFTLLAALSAAANVRHINVRDGLSSRQVYELGQDADGYVWIYTNSSLDRFDGYTIKHYLLDDSKEFNDHIQWATTMLKAPDGALRVAMKSGTIYRYNRDKDRFEVQCTFPQEVSLYTFAVLPAGDMLVCTDRGLYHWAEGQAPRLVALEGEFCDAISPGTADDYYIGTDHGMYRVELDNDYHATLVPGTSPLYVKSLQLVGERLFIGTFSQGMRVYDTETGSLSHLPFSIVPLPVNAMARYGSDGLLIGVDGAGVYQIDATTGKLLHHYTDTPNLNEDAISGNTVTDVLVDRDGGIWISTTHSGLNYVAPLVHSSWAVRTHQGEPSLVSDYVNVIYEDRDGDLWFGTDKGVSHHVLGTSQWKPYLQRGEYMASVILAIAQGDDGLIWTGSYGDGVSVIDKRNGTVRKMPSRAPGENTGMGTDYIFAIHAEPDGTVWLGGINGPITRYNPKNDSYRYYEEDCVASIVPDGKYGLLFGGNKGVGRYNKVTDLFSWKNRFDSIELRYPVRSMLSDTVRNVLWVGTSGEGLLRYDRANDKVRRFTTADGLSSNTIYSVTADKSGNVWVCTETDFYRVNQESDKITCFTSLLNTTHAAFNAGAAVYTSWDGLMLGSADGCLVFLPDSGSHTSAGNELLLTDLTMHGSSVRPGVKGSPLRSAINVSDKIELSHKQNSFNISFSRINFAEPQAIEYEYRLEGYDSAFIRSEGTPEARYVDVPYGKYTFRLRAVDLFTGEVLDERALGVEVMKPVWLTWWMKLLYTIAVVSLVLLAGNYLYRRQRERRIESQMQSYAAIAHDILTPMSMIKSPLLNVEREEGLSDEARSHLQQARTGVDKTMAMLTEMLELRNGSARMQTLQVTEIDIAEYLRVKAEEYSTLAMYKGLEIECEVEPGLTRVPVDPDKFDHIVDNFMSNALKYTERGTVTLRARLHGRRSWQLSVQDTGIGFTKADARMLFRRRYRSAEAVESTSTGMGMGLLITRRLVRSHKGKINFESTPGQGSTFTVTLPLNYDSRYYAKPAPSPAKTFMSDEPAEEGDSLRNSILVVDDDTDMLNYLSSTLSDEYDVRTISEPLQALEEINAKNPDIIISDVMMPKLHGNELCNIIKSDIATSHIPIILLSGLSSREDIVAGLEAHADDYVVKPFDIVVLKARIRNILKSRKALSRSILSEDSEPEKEEFTNELDRQFMTKVMESVNNHIGDSEFSVGDLCTDLGMSRTSVYNKIKSMTGQSLNEFIRIIRLNRSKELLASGRYNVSEVAYMVGFSDPKYFSTCFKKQFGISPSKMS